MSCCCHGDLISCSYDAGCHDNNAAGLCVDYYNVSSFGYNHSTLTNSKHALGLTN